MKKFLFRTFVFAILMIVCDVVVGAVGDYLVVHANGGNTKRKSYIVNGTKEDVLIFGSSRAAHHYDPDILEDSLGMTAYNCGFDGNGIICAYGFFHSVKERYYPKVLIYELSREFDIMTGDNNCYLGALKYFYSYSGIDSIFFNVDERESIKMLSHMYRYNSSLTEMLMDYVHPLREHSKGYNPINKNIDKDPQLPDHPEVYDHDSLKLYYLDRLIAECEGHTQLIFTISPKYMRTSDAEMLPLIDFCEQRGMPVVNHFTDTAFVFRKDFFADQAHLNRKGATEYSKVVVVEIKNLIGF